MPLTATVTKLPFIELPSYQVTSHWVTKLPSNQSSITSHQEDNYQTDEPKHQKRREEDTCLITVDYSFDTNWQRSNLYIEWLSNIMYQCMLWLSATLLNISHCPVYFNSLCLLYISGSQSLVVTSPQDCDWNCVWC